MNIKRINKLVKIMNENMIEMIIVSNPKTIEYFTDIYYEPGERMSVLLIDNDGKYTLFINSLFKTSLDKNIETILFDDTDDYVSLLANKMHNDGIIGIDPNWPARFLLPLQEKLNKCKFINSSFMVDKLRRIKDKNEQQLMRESSLINDEVMKEIITYVNKGYSEKEISNKLKEIYLQKGCSGVSFEPIISFGKNAGNPHHEPDNTRGKKGDCVVIDIGGLYKNYCSDMTRTVFLGEISEKHKEIYDIVLQANLKAEEKAKPGNKMSDVDFAARNYIESKGYGKYFTHRTGHSIGMEEHEIGDVSKTNNDIIEVGQVFSVEPGIYIPEENIGVRIEDLVLINEGGHEVLNHQTKDLIILPFEE